MPLIQTLPVTGSTNDDLLASSRDGAPEGAWLRAERQTGGKGRQGRAWESPPGNLHASTLVRLSASDPAAPTLALVAAVALHETASLFYSPPFQGGAGGGLRPSRLDAGEIASKRASSPLGRETHPQPLPFREGRLMLKWPNDLLAGPVKLAGILLERAGDAVVIGFGVNLAHAPTGLDRPVTSLAALTGAAPDPATFLEALADSFARQIDLWRRLGIAPIRTGWLAAAHPVGTALTTSAGDGLFEGLDETGALRLRLADGTLRAVHAGDVFLI